ncbi:MAG TPA: C25 family cysteine peptidase [Caldisericia bacterium]|nr:C25 family cysteine peptidase [Caldisericia bacterium]
MRIKSYYRKIIFFSIIFIFISIYFPSKSYSEKSDTILVLETTKLPSSFLKFKELKENEGFNIEVLNINSLNGDKDESLRDYLRENLEKMSIKYLLIVGSDKLFPMKRLTPRGDNVHDQFDGDLVDTPSDIYFVDPFEDFDKDKDGNFGEYPDDNIEIEPYVLVGRIPLDNQSSLDKYFSSLVEFEIKPFNEKNSALLIGAYLAFKGEKWYDRDLENEDGAYFMEKIIDDFIIKNGISPIRVYENEGTLPSAYTNDFTLSNKNISNLLNEKTFGFINISAHGNPYSVARMIWNDNDSDYKFNENESKTYIFFNVADIPEGLKGGVVFASSCLTAYPESEINLSREFLSKGGSAYIGATRISWGPTYWKGPEDGGLLTINYLFVKNFIDSHQTVGEAFWNSIVDYHTNYFENDKEDPIEAAQMNTYTFNLFGDPTLNYALENDSFSLSSSRYSESSFKDDSIFLKYNLLTKYNSFQNGFIYKTKENGEIFRINELNYEKEIRLIESDNISYLFKKEYEEKIELIYFGKEKNIILRFSNNLEPEKAKYYDKYRNIAIFKVREGDSIIFKKIDKEEYFIDSNSQNIIIYRDKKFDYNGDEFVNKKDFYIFSKHFGVDDKSKLFSDNFDIFSDNKVDGLDLIYLSIKNRDVIK